ncbi:MAG: hypothetical protein EZS28_012068 [Streblomastix strix]|uniref:Uncharacterized protein n=1 Tax=Streblomastix strix TaxID=222440 RepID=A0A5J4WD78_9EUKA|nr:MAG: hypothetical protein EZS28_012068 [Streblomastix strix]
MKEKKEKEKEKKRKEKEREKLKKKREKQRLGLVDIDDEDEDVNNKQKENDNDDNDNDEVDNDEDNDIANKELLLVVSKMNENEIVTTLPDELIKYMATGAAELMAQKAQQQLDQNGNNNTDEEDISSSDVIRKLKHSSSFSEQQNPMTLFNDTIPKQSQDKNEQDELEKKKKKEMKLKEEEDKQKQREKEKLNEFESVQQQQAPVLITGKAAAFELMKTIGPGTSTSISNTTMRDDIRETIRRSEVGNVKKQIIDEKDVKQLNGSQTTNSKDIPLQFVAGRIRLAQKTLPDYYSATQISPSYIEECKQSLNDAIISAASLAGIDSMTAIGSGENVDEKDEEETLKRVFNEMIVREENEWEAQLIFGVLGEGSVADALVDDLTDELVAKLIKEIADKQWDEDMGL